MSSFHHLVQKLATNIRVTYSALPGIKPLKVHQDLATISGNLEEEKLLIHNELYKCPGLRKIHLETAKLGSLDVLHSVFFPDPNYDLPIFGADIVATPRGVGAAIVDLSPVNGLSKHITDQLVEKSNKYRFKERRALPLWGDEIFSPYCKFVRLHNTTEENDFVSIVQDYLDIFTHAVMEAKPDREDWISVMKRFDDQIWYCKQQKKNDKTRGILAKCFNDEWADKYLNDLLFDEPPKPE
tara:strand:- start:716 stop:1435 length:720 start_codon:yes stop_codon:yes gene_type:complete